jgi:glyoxylase-like metal-dependent hydrolase (beta-lactamase superfamily II)
MKRKAEGGSAGSISSDDTPKQARCEANSPGSFEIGQIRVHCIVEEIQVIDPAALFTLTAATSETDEGPQLRAMVRCADWLFPAFAENGGKLKTAVQMFVIETPGGKRIAVGTGRSSAMLSVYDKTKFRRDSIDFVIFPQLHANSIGCTVLSDGEPAFPKAKYIWSAKEHASRQSVNEASTKIDPIVDAGLHQLIDLSEGESILVDEGDAALISCVAAPGPSAGSMCIRLKSNGSQSFVVGGAIAHPLQLHSINLRALADTNADAAIDTRLDLLGQLADTNTVVIGTSFAPPSRGHIVLDREKISDYKLSV